MADARERAEQAIAASLHAACGTSDNDCGAWDFHQEESEEIAAALLDGPIPIAVLLAGLPSARRRWAADLSAASAVSYADALDAILSVDTEFVRAADLAPLLAAVGDELGEALLATYEAKGGSSAWRVDKSERTAAQAAAATAYHHIHTALKRLAALPEGLREADSQMTAKPTETVAPHRQALGR